MRYGFTVYFQHVRKFISQVILLTIRLMTCDDDNCYNGTINQAVVADTVFDNCREMTLRY